MLQAKYTTKKTAEKYGLDMRYTGFVEAMGDFEKTVKITNEYVMVMDAETGEHMDTAEYILVKGEDGNWYGNLLLSEMNSFFDHTENGNDWATNEDIDISGLPLRVKRMMN